MKVRVIRVMLDADGSWKDVPGMVVGILADETEFHSANGMWYVTLLIQEIGSLATEAQAQVNWVMVDSALADIEGDEMEDD